MEALLEVMLLAVLGDYGRTVSGTRGEQSQGLGEDSLGDYGRTVSGTMGGQSRGLWKDSLRGLWEDSLGGLWEDMPP